MIFAVGKPLYKIKAPKGNMIVKVSKAIGVSTSYSFLQVAHRSYLSFQTAIKGKVKSKEKKDHWLDYATEKHGAELVSDIRGSLQVLLLYLPLPVFWALYDQQGSAWTFQANRMDGYVGFYTILPDQMQVQGETLSKSYQPLLGSRFC